MLSDSYGRDMDADLEYGRDWEVFEYQGEGRHCRSGETTGECEDQALRLNLLQFDFIAALSVAGKL